MATRQSKFYTYIHRRKSDGSVFYVGKGKGHRAEWQHGRNPLWRATAAKHGFTAEVVAYFDTESAAFEHERTLIAEHRASGARLTNFSDGGEGQSGFRFSVEQRRQLSECQRATWARPGYKERHRLAQAAVFGRESYRAKQSAAMKARWSDPERRPPPRFHDANNHARAVRCVDTGRLFGSISLAVLWLHSIGISNAVRTRIVACCRENGRSAYGYHWHYAEESLTADEIAWRLKGYAKGADHYRARAVRCMETGTVFATATDAVAWFSESIAPVTSAEMSGCCKFEQRHIRGYHFHFADTPPSAAQLVWMHEGRPSGARSPVALPIVCIETGQAFETATAAVRWLRDTVNPKASIANVANCAKHGKPRSAYGYHWRLA